MTATSVILPGQKLVVAGHALTHSRELRRLRIPRVLITGPPPGLGKAAVEGLIRDGHDVVLQDRNHARGEDLANIAHRAIGVVIGDLATPRTSVV